MKYLKGRLPKGSSCEYRNRHSIYFSLARGRGAVPLNNLMEDAATAEISRAQVWQWIKHPEGKLETGKKVTIDLVKDLLDDKLQAEHPQATKLFLDLIEQDSFESFLTLPAYHVLKEGE